MQTEMQEISKRLSTKVALAKMAEFARLASTFGDLMYKTLISRIDTTISASTFIAGLLSRSVGLILTDIRELCE